jgi:hypothetical protein
MLDPFENKSNSNFFDTCLCYLCAFLGLIRYYKNYIKGYANIIVHLFELTKKM